MKQVYLDTVILKIIENSGSDPDLRQDFVRRVVMDRLRESVPDIFFPISMSEATLEDGVIFLEEPFVEIIAVTKKRDVPKFLCIIEEKVYDPGQSFVPEYILEDEIISRSKILREYDFTVDSLSNKITVYSEEKDLSVFFYSLYKDKNSRIVIPSFCESYLIAYGSLRALEVLLNKNLRGKTPGMVPQTRYTIGDMRKMVTREFLSMQSEINLLSDKVIIKTVNSSIDAKF